VYFGRKPYSVVKTQIGDGLGIDTVGLGMVDTAFLACYAAGQFVLTPYGDKLGPKLMLWICLAISGLCSVGMSASSGVISMMLLNGINGLVQSVTFPLMVKVLSRWYDAAQRGTVLGVWTTCQQVGGVLSTSFAGYLAAHYGWRQCLFVCGMTVVANGVSIFTFLQDSPNPISDSDKDIETEDKKNAPPLEEAPSKDTNYRTIVMIPGILNLGASYFFIKLARYTLMFWLPFFLNKEHGYGAAEAAYISTLFDVGGVAGSLSCGYVSDKVFGGRRLLCAGPMCVFTGEIL
jgi:sugar phosphate permease